MIESKEGVIFRLRNPDLPTDPLVQIVKVDGRLYVVLEVGEDVGAEELRKAIPNALNYRDRLLESQGPWMSGGHNLYLDRLSGMQGPGRLTYSEIAQRINAQVAEHMAEFHRLAQCYQDSKADFEAERAKLKADVAAGKATEADAMLRLIEASVPIQAEFGRAESEKHWVLWYLEALRVKPKDYSAASVEDLLNAAMSRVMAGERPFLDGCPVSAYRVRATLFSWRRSKKHKLIEQTRRSKRGTI